MFNLDYITTENNENHNKKWPYIPDHPYGMLLIGSSGSGKSNALLNLIKEQDSENLIGKIYTGEGGTGRGPYRVTKHQKNDDFFQKILLYRNIFFKKPIPKIFTTSQVFYVSPGNQT